MGLAPASALAACARLALAPEQSLQGTHSPDTGVPLATALLEDQRAAEAAAQAALARLAELEAAKEPEEVLTMAEAVAREEEAEMRAALAAANDGRAEWEEFFDEASGLPYYVHYQTGEFVWEKPDTA